jgi:hypothetical protein
VLECATGGYVNLSTAVCTDVPANRRSARRLKMQGILAYRIDQVPMQSVEVTWDIAVVG